MIENVSEDIIVKVRRSDHNGSVINRVRIDLDDISAGYDRDNEWNSLNDGARRGDAVAFYRLDVEY